MASDLLFVNGTLMRGLALHGNLEGAEFVGATRTAPIYRLYSIDDRHPGMFEVAEGGVSVAGELYRVPDEVWTRVEAGEPPGLYRGTIALSDGRRVPGILFPRELAEGKHRDISDYGDWRAYRRNHVPPVARTMALGRLTADRRRTALMDKTLTCKDCGQQFVWTTSEQEFYASRGLQNPPGRCKSCREARKAAGGGGGRRYGDERSSYGGPREMFTATCSNCGGEARVPFQPRGDKPVYCANCFEQMRPARSGRRY